jgi:hypothetical protein
MRNPDAMPACCGGMPAIAVTETATKTMPTPSPSTSRPGNRLVANWAVPEAVDNRVAPVAARVRPVAAMLRGEVRASSLLAT